jgi:hemerythrin superfamily protein
MKAKIRLLVFIGVVGILFSACDSNELKAPPIPKEKMERILLDINLAESYSTMVKDSSYKVGQKNSDSLGTYYKEIFDHYHVTAEEFQTSLSWYKARTNEIDTLFSEILPIVSGIPGTR